MASLVFENRTFQVGWVLFLFLTLIFRELAGPKRFFWSAGFTEATPIFTKTFGYFRGNRSGSPMEVLLRNSLT